MPALTCHVTYRTQAPAVVRLLRRIASHPTAQDCGYLALTAAACWAVLRLLQIIQTVVLLFVY